MLAVFGRLLGGGRQRPYQWPLRELQCRRLLCVSQLANIKAVAARL
jgi:hypothetical protein